MADPFFGEQPKPKETNPTATQPNQNINLADLFKQKEYQDAYLDNKEQVKMTDIIDMPIVITNYELDKMQDAHSPGVKECFKLTFYLAEDEQKRTHFVMSEATRLWTTLKTINEVNPDILKSGTLQTMICEKPLGGMYKGSKVYFFAGLE